MKVISGTFVGTGAALHIGIGFKPDFVKVFNISASAVPALEWNTGMSGTTAIAEGVKQIALRSVAKLAAGAGIAQYDGGDIMSALSTVYLVKKAAGTYDFEGAPALDNIPAGFSINETAAVNISGQVCYFEAGCYE